MRKMLKTLKTLKTLLNDYRVVKSKTLNFGLKKETPFENIKLNKEKIDIITRKIEQNPRKESRMKKFLYNLLIKTGVKLGDYVDYTLKRLIKLTIKYIGPVVILAMLFRHREPVYNTLVSKQDREKIKSARPF